VRGPRSTPPPPTIGGTFVERWHFPLPSVAIFESEYKNGIFHAIIVSMRAGIALFNGCSLRLKPGPYITTESIHARPLRLFGVGGTSHCPLLQYDNFIKKGLVELVYVSHFVLVLFCYTVVVYCYN
jgi:hypothetical protein